MPPYILLKASKGRDRKPTGNFECSACSCSFQPNPSWPGEMKHAFEYHVAYSHPDEQLPYVVERSRPLKHGISLKASTTWNHHTDSLNA
jgi:hypothetical protein